MTIWLSGIRKVFSLIIYNYKVLFDTERPYRYTCMFNEKQTHQFNKDGGTFLLDMYMSVLFILQIVFSISNLFFQLQNS